MPYKSARQRRYMHAVHPEIAERWDEEDKKRHEHERKHPSNRVHAFHQGHSGDKR